MVRGSKPGGSKIFLICPDRLWDPPSLLYNGYRIFPGGKERPGRDADPSPTSSAAGHERVELYLYSPYGPYGLYRASVPVQGWPLPLLLPPGVNPIPVKIIYHISYIIYIIIYLHCWDMCTSAIRRTHSWPSVLKTVTRTHHGVTLYVHGLFGLVL